MPSSIRQVLAIAKGGDASHLFGKGAIMPGMLEEFRETVRAALREDLGAGDATTDSTIPADAIAVANMVARESIVVAGLPLARFAFEEQDPELQFTAVAAEGSKANAGQTLMAIHGNARAILEAERVALNFVQHLSGIATLTRQYVDAISGTSAKILDTRKTLPGWRKLEKYAVTCGGGQNHRLGLDDMILIKDNHLAVLRRTTEQPISVAVLAARAKYPKLKIEVEADTAEQAAQIAEAGADFVLLDNMSPETLREAVQKVGQKIQTEASSSHRRNRRAFHFRWRHHAFGAGGGHRPRLRNKVNSYEST
jgi:nicotinate-nucleotide pyrophosphorylase (carboxylating)